MTPFVMPYAITVAPLTGPLTAVPLMVPLFAAGVVPLSLLPLPPPQPESTDMDPIKNVRAKITRRFLFLFTVSLLIDFVLTYFLFFTINDD